MAWAYGSIAHHGDLSGAVLNAPIVGMAVLRIQFLDAGSRAVAGSRNIGPEVRVRCKVFGKGSSDWHGLILGGKALDCVENGGLGFRPGPRAHVQPW